jgi:hypothetical protein
MTSETTTNEKRTWYKRRKAKEVAEYGRELTDEERRAKAKESRQRGSERARAKRGQAREEVTEEVRELVAEDGKSMRKELEEAAWWVATHGGKPRGGLEALLAALQKEDPMAFMKLLMKVLPPEEVVKEEKPEDIVGDSVKQLDEWMRTWKEKRNQDKKEEDAEGVDLPLAAPLESIRLADRTVSVGALSPASERQGAADAPSGIHDRTPPQPSDPATDNCQLCNTPYPGLPWCALCRRNHFGPGATPPTPANVPGLVRIHDCQNYLCL